MNQHLQTILSFIQQSEHLSDDEKTALSKAAKDAAKELDITTFKLDRTEKVKRTTAILLEETIEELENKRKAVEAQNRELEVESSLERVRTVAMGMSKPDDLLSICETMFHELKKLGFADLRNTMIDIHYDDKKYLLNYDYSETTGRTVTHYVYHSHPVIDNLTNHARQSNGAFTEMVYSGETLNEWRAFRQKNGEADDPRLDNINALCYYFYSIGTGAIGISTFDYASQEHLNVLKRFRNVFDLAYKRYIDITTAAAQAREAQIEAALEKVRSRSLAMQKSDELKEVIQVVYDQLVHLNILVEHAGFIMDYKERDDMHIWLADKHEIPSEVTIPYFDSPHWNSFIEAKAIGKDFFANHLSFEEKNKFYKDLFQLFPISDEAKEYYFTCAGLAISTVLLDNVGLYIENFSGFPYSDEDNKTLMRFGKVFQQTYTRFLDLQKAEAQTRESQIQLALERARAQSMMMQHSIELDETLRVFHEQVLQLNIPSAFSFLWLPDEEKNRHIFWAAWAENKSFKSKAINYPLDKNEPATAQCLIDWKGNEPVVAYHVPPEGVRNYFAAWSELIAGVDELQPQFFIDGLYYVEAFMKYGCFGVMVRNALAEDETKILERFATEFERAYTRFLDLQKAEAQTRESQIELSLERVRAKTMAMHNSADVGETASVMVEELKKLGIETIRCGIGIMHEPGDMEVWTISTDENKKTDIIIGWLDMNMHPLLHGAFESWRNKIETYSYELKGEDLLNYYNAINNYPGYPIKYDVSNLPKQIHHNEFHFTEGTLFAFSLQQLTDEQRKIFKRFANVFGQTYRRYLDLKKAETSAREAQIEAALERVRSKAMMMQKSEDLSGAVAIVFEELNKLNIGLIRCGIGILDKHKRTADLFTTTISDNNSTMQVSGDESMDIHPLLHNAFEAWLKQEDCEYVLKGEDLNKYYKALTRVNFKLPQSQSLTHTDDDVCQYYYNAIFSFGGLFAFNDEPITGEAKKIMKRFATVFEQTYTRFLDIKKAEAQAREAQMETALERVRAIAMSMMKSDELMNICEAVFKQLQILGFTETRSAQIYIRNDAEEKFLNYNYSELTGADKVEVNYNSHANTRRIYDVIRNAGDGLVHNMINKKELDEWKSYLYKTLGQHPEKNLDEADELHYYLYSFGTGAFGISTFKAISDDELAILKRFRNVFSLSYQRYTDIALAEAQAREAQIEAALERVRSRTLAMQKSDELAETSAVLFKQLIHLGISPNRLYISIMKDDAGNTEFWITDEDGSKVSMAYEDNLNNNASFKKMFAGWKQQKKSLVIDMKGKELKEYLNHLISIHVPFKGGLKQKRRLQYVAYFSKGFIGMASPDEQSAETLQLLERFAYAFNLTFTRFNDLQIAEAHAVQAEQDLIEIKAARKKAEDTLSELQVTQRQLIQSEKMASLGELTAGIAHEIQNPLNFVNNFSEVNKEMLEELKAERIKPNADKKLEDDLINDLVDNSEKINHHGKRADAIVKGMLQHSRKSSGKKEPTDINALCDEYIRLCYHGLRAKDKSFNASINTDFDKNIEKINIIPQDISRVILNIVTNAFYAVNEKSRQSTVNGPRPLLNEYKPVVSVSTRKINDKIEIIITDNGNGIPSNIIDKIFQPFFTTKPTGQGTGLGLSLAYDIITKEHNGTIKAESKEGEGTTFIINLPVA